MNDVVDLKEDIIERPFRPIPSGQIKKKKASLLVVFLSVLALTSSYLFSWQFGVMTSTLLLIIICYNFLFKNTLLGPINMGLVRFFNWLLVLGMIGSYSFSFIFIATMVFVYTTLVTVISHYETSHFPNKIKPLLVILVVIMLTIIIVAYNKNDISAVGTGLLAIFFSWLLFSIITFKSIDATNTQKWMTTLLKLMVVLDGFILIGFEQYIIGLICISLIFFSGRLGRYVYLT